MTRTQWEVLKWAGNIFLLLATLTMMSPHAASSSITPWLLFLMANIIWFADSVHVKSWPWASIAAFLGTWDILIMVSRLTGVQVFSILDPLITIIDKLP